MTLRVAIASNDGTTVNLHFGHADRFHVYDVAPGAITFVEVRKNAPSCQPGEGRHPAHLRTLESLADCQAVVVAAVGPHALGLIEASGIACYQSEDLIASVLTELADLGARRDAATLQ